MNYSSNPTLFLKGAVGGGGGGAVDDVRIYNRALSAQEVKQLYNMGRP